MKNNKTIFGFLAFMLFIFSACSDDEKVKSGLSVSDLWDQEMFDIQVNVSYLDFTDANGLDTGKRLFLFISGLYDYEEQVIKVSSDDISLKINGDEVELRFLKETVMAYHDVDPKSLLDFELNINGDIATGSLKLAENVTFKGEPYYFQNKQNLKIEWELAENTRMQYITDTFDPYRSKSKFSKLLPNDSREYTIAGKNFTSDTTYMNVLVSNINYFTAGKIVFVSESASVTKLISKDAQISRGIFPKDKVLLEVFNSRGHLISSNMVVYDKIGWNGTDTNDNAVPSGIYYYLATSESVNDFGKILLLK